MMALFHSEWERLWKRKITWLFLIAIPLIIALTAKYYIGHNASVPLGSPEHTTAENFPVMAMIEQLIVVFNVVALVLLTFPLRRNTVRANCGSSCCGHTAARKFLGQMAGVCVHDGFVFRRLFGCGGRRRMRLFRIFAAADVVLLRSCRFKPIHDRLYAQLLRNGLCLDRRDGIRIYRDRRHLPFVDRGHWPRHGILLCSLGFPLIYDLFNRVTGFGWPAMLKYVSLTEIQFSGIAVMLSGSASAREWHAGLWMVLILAGYVAVFTAAARLIFTKSDRFI